MNKIIAIKKILDSHTPFPGVAMVSEFKAGPNVVKIVKCPFSFSYLVTVDFDTDDVSKIVFNDNGKKFTFSSVAEFNRHFTREKQPNLRKVYPEPK